MYLAYDRLESLLQDSSREQPALPSRLTKSVSSTSSKMKSSTPDPVCSVPLVRVDEDYAKQMDLVEVLNQKPIAELEDH